MLEHLRQRVVETLASARQVTLSTYGAAALQASLVPCEAAGMCLYLLVPSTSDHLLNLESEPDALITTAGWQLRGLARVVGSEGYPPDLELLRQAEARWSRLVAIQPRQLHIARGNGWNYSETIDIEL